MQISKRYETKLETAGAQNIVAILDAKLEATSPESVTDYVGFAIENLDAQIERYKNAQKELSEMVKCIEIQKDIIKIGSALWLTESGISKLDGNIVSSMSIYTPKTKEVLKVLSEESLINQGFFKTTVDKTAVKQAINDGVNVDGAEIEVEHQSDTLKINKKKNAIKS